MTAIEQKGSNFDLQPYSVPIFSVAIVVVVVVVDLNLLDLLLLRLVQDFFKVVGQGDQAHRPLLNSTE